jgi:2-keto-3-deoxy-L-rhamnonate aldolase RhmA
MRVNKLREKLNSGEPTVSTHILSVWPSVVEAIGHTGLYDYVEFVAEYGSFDLHDLDNLCRAAELHGMGTMIKIDQSHQSFLAQRGIGAGFSSVLFTDARSAEDVRTAALDARPDTPDHGGMYGTATRRNSYMGYGGSQDYVNSVADTVIAVMIEKKGAIEELDEILSIPELDMVQWGGSDYSMSIGQAGQRYTPEIDKVRLKVFEMALEKGVHPRAEIRSVDEVPDYMAMGVRHFSIGTDLAILHDWWKEQGTALQKAISDGAR